MMFTKAILDWYSKNARDLPWRRTTDPYLIWISEVILQQTRIGQGIGYYNRFIARFPTVADLAKAEEEDVLKIWQGLGYYSRARHLHSAAREVMDKHNGRFPSTCEGLMRLPGIGSYTAAAIGSIAFGIPEPVVDGNVIRFFARYLGIYEATDTSAGKKKVLEKARKFMDKRRPGMFNQAIMEFGALQCTPGKPDCPACPMKSGCIALREDAVAILPTRSKPKLSRSRYFSYLVIISGKKKGSRTIFLRKRREKDIWKNLYDFPLIETETGMNEESLVSSAEWKRMTGDRKFRIAGRSHKYVHLLTHQRIHAIFYLIKTKDQSIPGPYIPVPEGEIGNYPVSRLIEEFLNEYMAAF